MNSAPISDNWEHGSAYERYIGRWSRRVAPAFVDWLGATDGHRWVDIGCGTGALCAAILDRCAPSSLIGVEPSDGFRASAARNLGSGATVLAGSADALPLADGACDLAVSGLVLNFLPDLRAAMAQISRVVAPNGTIAAYVWDYAGRMEVIKRFWDAAVALDPVAAPLHEGVRFPLCNPDALRAAFASAGLTQIDAAPLDVVAEFEDFDDYWHPFLGGQGPAPAYVMSLPEERRMALRTALEARWPASAGQRTRLDARAWAVRGTTPQPSC